MSRQTIVARVYDKKGRLLATGYNSYTKTHPRQADLARRVGYRRKIYLHAEIAAIIRASKQGIQQHSISVERRGASGESRCARPCAVCQLAIKEAGIKEVRYTI